MFLHSPLTVVERSEHSFDPFPDNGRVLPWGVGCSIVYNYVDLVVRNDTERDLPAADLASATGTCEGTLLGDRPLRALLQGVEARDEQFVRLDGDDYRTQRDLAHRRRQADRRRGGRGAGQAQLRPGDLRARPARVEDLRDLLPSAR